MALDLNTIEFMLPDDTAVLIRPIRPDDKSLLERGMQELSPESRYRRFFHSVERLTQAQLRYFTEVDGINHSAFVCVRADAPKEGVGVGRWIRLKDEPDAAEGAVTVIDRYHNQGVGKTLLYVLARDAIDKGIRTFRAWVVGENSPMLHVLGELGGIPGRWEQAALELNVPLPETVDELDRTAAPLILKAVAAGEIEGTLHPGRSHGVALRDPVDTDPA